MKETVEKIAGQFRQGDVLVHPITAYSRKRNVTAVPGDAQRIAITGPIVLAYGSTTGHSHQIPNTENVEMFQQPGGRRFLVVDGQAMEVELQHEEHGAIPLRALTVPAEVLIQEEYERGAMRQVMD